MKGSKKGVYSFILDQEEFDDFVKYLEINEFPPSFKHLKFQFLSVIKDMRND